MIEQWQELKETITEMRDNDGTSSQQDVCKFLANYMEVLEKQMQEPMRDAVSRTLVHEAITASIAESENPYEMWQRIEALPSVTPQRPEGRWMATENEEMNIVGYYCSCCDLPMETEERTKYCPNCGAKMKAESEDKE